MHVLCDLQYGKMYFNEGYMNALNWQIFGKVGILQINRPEVLNALDFALFEQMQQLLLEVSREEKISVLILTGTGDKAFIAGADIAAMKKMEPQQIINFCSLGHKVATALQAGPFITIAAINGYALGGGLEMAMACDLIYARTGAMLGLPEVTLGLIPGFGGSRLLTHAIGERKAKELLFTGKLISSEEALCCGLINGIYPQEQLLPHCKQIAESIAANPFTAVSSAKKSIAQAYDSPTKSHETDLNLFIKCFNTSEASERMQAFLTKKA